MLEMDGLELVQSQAIIRYLARKHSLVGSTAKVRRVRRGFKAKLGLLGRMKDHTARG